jgi:hypothetical protein
MSLQDLRKITNQMEPEDALSALAGVAKDIFSILGEDARLKFVVSLTGEAGKDKISSLVHL